MDSFLEKYQKGKLYIGESASNLLLNVANSFPLLVHVSATDYQKMH